MHNICQVFKGDNEFQAFQQAELAKHSLSIWDLYKAHSLIVTSWQALNCAEIHEMLHRSYFIGYIQDEHSLSCLHMDMCVGEQWPGFQDHLNAPIFKHLQRFDSH